MNALPHCCEIGAPLLPEAPWDYDESVRGQHALCACALTCRAWRVRAQYLLSIFPFIRNVARLARFTMAVQESSIIGLMLGGYQQLDASKASELFMRSRVGLQLFWCVEVCFDRGPPLRLLRMRLPFFTGITTLRLWHCTFQSFRAMMDVVWACRNLAMLDISVPCFEVNESPAAQFEQMTATVKNLRACQKLTSLYLDTNILPASSHVPPLNLRPFMTYSLYRQSGAPLVPD